MQIGKKRDNDYTPDEEENLVEGFIPYLNELRAYPENRGRLGVITPEKIEEYVSNETGEFDFSHEIEDSDKFIQSFGIPTDVKNGLFFSLGVFTHNDERVSFDPNFRDNLPRYLNRVNDEFEKTLLSRGKKLGRANLLCFKYTVSDIELMEELGYEINFNPK